jgi:hypothetical protein
VKTVKGSTDGSGITSSGSDSATGGGSAGGVGDSLAGVSAMSSMDHAP